MDVDPPFFLHPTHTLIRTIVRHFIMIIITPSVRLEVFAVYVRNPTWLGFFLLDQKKASPNKVAAAKAHSLCARLGVCECV